ncbi:MULTISPECIES: hypothetical protein [Mycobacterium avium complex (MAC)]|uniref:Lipoprotein n=3 Tax=Mycobacterium avium complex (MAC) TaxID=120793 RepID=A0AAW5S5J9_MYCBC|nr:MULTISPECIES: hypothetical protein [Mycobacterium avium complex (MAC)]ETA92674.1 hypothetical protein O984_12020 [Mycobacterium avium 05-4293]ETB25189.1 hypothetical protein O983_11180 [Mycobacterium avium 09-5983]ETB46434.1 hypothetical protein O974_11895 [Mycobacterium avium 11-0986]ETB53246.1 hypothetical protein O981_12070 [Mycobacterium avium 10-5560]EUA39590.1 hypothetical protein I549_3857 [Mycobacterium avium subsp. avium 2285 (R)]TXA41730.1 hypothetical protein DKM27_11055 [Mycoba
MTKVRTSALGLTATAVLVGATVVGCGGDKNPAASSSPAASTPSAASPSAGAPADYSNLLIKPGDVGPNATADGPPSQNPSGITGVGQVFKNPDGKRTIMDTIAVFPDPATAAQTAANMRDVVGKKVNGPQQPIDIGSNGFMVIGQGSDPANPMEISEAVFVEGRAMVDLESDCVIGNPTPADVLLDLARKQDAAVKAGLPAG